MIEKPLRLILFFTYGISLRVWDENGSFDREVALYQQLQARGVDVSFVTYGDASDLTYTHRIPGIHILCNRWGLPRGLYKRLISLLHARYLARCHVIKTNQISGADVALRVARIWHKPLIARCGYMWSDFMVRQHGTDSEITQRVFQVEKDVFSAARSIVVTTQAMADDVAARVPGAANRTHVIPNYVNTNHFRPTNRPEEKDFDLVFVGRMNPQKNIEAVLEALQSLNVHLLLIGSGELENALKQRFGDLDGRVIWRGSVPNNELPEYLNRARVFILPSLYEGHPKTLIEAMSCGLPVIGADSPGIREIIQHGETGWLCGTDSASIRDSVQRLLDDPALCAQLGQNARQYVLKHYALDHLAQLEYQLIQEVVLR